MFLKYNGKLKSAACELRKNMTDAEKLLWLKIKGKQIKGAQFYRQKTIGNFIVDFYCPSAKLIIEVDGGQHYEKDSMEKDKSRDEYLKSLGLKVLRFDNFEVLKNIEGVLKKIYGEIKEIHLNIPLKKEGIKIPLTPFAKGGIKKKKIHPNPPF